MVFSTHVYAAPIGYSVSTFGPTRITSNTGLEWLSASESVGLSFNDVLADITANSTASIYYGYRRATDLEFKSLLSDYGLVNTGW